MAGYTTFYGMTYFTFGDDLDDGVNVASERDRFLFIDKQLYGLSRVFGDGIIEGWIITKTDTGIAISEGYGFIDGNAAQTVNIVEIENLQPDVVYYVYAEFSRNYLSINRDVVFDVETAFSSSKVYLGTVYNDVIDYTVRSTIRFSQINSNLIANHKHRGSPSKINLATETQGFLSTAQIEDFDASIIKTGKLDIERIPQLDHTELKGTGLLSHAALDSFARAISTNNRQLLGEVAAVNTLKLITAQHYLASESDINLSDIVDYTNMFVMYPGITPNKGIDFQASNANINLNSKCISGKPPNLIPGDLPSSAYKNVVWDSNSAFKTFYASTNIQIRNNTISLPRGLNNATNIDLIVDDFESVQNAGDEIRDYNISTTVLTDNMKVLAENSDGNKTQGFYSAKFTNKRSYRVIYRKSLTSNKNWSQYNELLIDVKTLTQKHKPVYFYIVNNSLASPPFVLLAQDEVTENADPLLNSFETRVIDISAITRDNITSIVFYTDETEQDLTFYIDNIYVRGQAQFTQTGTATYRFATSATVIFNSISYEAAVPEGCSLSVKVRVANSVDLLDRQTYSGNLLSGSVINKTGTAAEILITLTSDVTQRLSPTISELNLQYLVESEESGFRVDNAEAWDRGTYVNLAITDDLIVPDGVNLTLANPISANDLYYINNNFVNQNTPDGVAVYGFKTGTIELLRSPRQTLATYNNIESFGLTDPTSVYRLIANRFLVADTSNDRVLLFERDGTFIRGIGGYSMATQSSLYLMNAVINPVSKILYLCFSQPINDYVFDKTKVSLYLNFANVVLDTFDVVQDVIGNFIIPIKLSDDKILEINSDNTSVYVDIRNGVFTDGSADNNIVNLGLPNNSQKLYTSRGLQAFVGEFTYVLELTRPVYANLALNDEWLICASSIRQDAVAERLEVTLEDEASTRIDITTPEITDAIGGTDYIVEWKYSIPETIKGIVQVNEGGANVPANNILPVSIGPSSANLRGTYSIVFTAEYRDLRLDRIIRINSSTLLLNLIEKTDPTQDIYVDLMRVSPVTGSISFSLDKIKFSDFTLGSAIEIEPNVLLIAGLEYTTTPQVEPTPSIRETYAELVRRKLINYIGKIIIYDINSQKITFSYTSPDGLYPCDANYDNQKLIVSGESSFSGASGRVVKIDAEGNVTYQVGDGLFGKINDVRSKPNDDIIVST